MPFVVKGLLGKKELWGFLKALLGQFYGRGVSKEIPWKMGKILLMKKARLGKKKIKGKQKDASTLWVGFLFRTFRAQGVSFKDTLSVLKA